MDKSMTWKAAGIAVAAALYIGGSYIPEVADQLNMLAGLVVGWLGLRRPGDAKQ